MPRALANTSTSAVAVARAGAPFARMGDTAPVADHAVPHRAIGGFGFDALGLNFDVETGDGLTTSADWTAFEREAVATLFQTSAWLSAWTRVAAAAHDETPVIAIGRRSDGRIGMILPLALTRRLGRPTLTWLGQSHLNYAMPLYAADVMARAQPSDMAALIRRIAADVGADAIFLTDQPLSWQGRSNPLAAAAGSGGINDSFSLALDADFDTQYKVLFSSKTRSQLRRKSRRLADIGAVEVGTAATTDERLHLLETFFAMKRGQLAEQGAANPFQVPAIQAFYRDLATHPSTDKAALEITSLAVSGRIAAIALAMRHGDTCYMLNTAFAADEDLRDASPGKLLIHDHVAASHRAGARTYDFGPGDAAYKADWHATTVPLATLTLGITTTGRLIAAALTATHRTKRAIKRSPRLWHAAQTLRRMLRRQPT
jgi:CelD/BcsL family acetyltransferase involved in cellulose biosynthesis